MNIFRAELFRYRKSFYSRLIYLLIFPCAGIVAIVLKYASTGMSSDFLLTAGFSQEAVYAISSHMSGISYIVSSLSAAEYIMILAVFPIIIHITDDYDYKTIRYEQQRSAGRISCYLARCMAAVVYAWSVLLEYMAVSGVISFLFFGRDGKDGEWLRLLTAVAAELAAAAAFTLLIYMLVSIIRHPILSMAAVLLLVLLATPGIELLTELFELPEYAGDIWIVSLLHFVSDFAFQAKDILFLVTVSILYSLISVFLGMYFYKKQKI